MSAKAIVLKLVMSDLVIVFIEVMSDEAATAYSSCIVVPNAIPDETVVNEEVDPKSLVEFKIQKTVLDCVFNADKAAAFKEIEFKLVFHDVWPEYAVGEPPISTVLKSVVAKAVCPSPPKALPPSATMQPDELLVTPVTFNVALVTSAVIPLVSKYI